VSHSVRELVDLAFGHLGLDLESHVRTDPSLLRPAEVDELVADPSHAREELGWAASVSFEELVVTMVEADLELLG